MESYNTQFDNEPLEQVPDPTKKYYLTEHLLVTGFTYLFKLLWLADKHPDLDYEVYFRAEDVNVKVNDWPALYLVCRTYKSHKLPEIVRLLISLGADVNATDKDNNTALHFLFRQYNQYELQTMHLLIDGGININAKNNIHNTVLHDLCSYHELDDLLDIIRILIKSGADMNIKNSINGTYLHDLCDNYKSYNLPEVMNILIDAGVDINAIDDYGSTTLDYLCDFYKLNDLYELIQILIRAGANSRESTIIQLNSSEIYDSIITYRKHDSTQIEPFFEYFDEEQIKLLDCFKRNKTLLKSIIEPLNDIYYYPNNIGALLCESNFVTSFNRTFYSNKSQFLFNWKN